MIDLTHKKKKKFKQSTWHWTRFFKVKTFCFFSKRLCQYICQIHYLITSNIKTRQMDCTKTLNIFFRVYGLDSSDTWARWDKNDLFLFVMGSQHRLCSCQQPHEMVLFLKAPSVQNCIKRPHTFPPLHTRQFTYKAELKI